LLESVKKTSDKISRLEIQGARNVAIAAIKSLETLASETKTKTKKQFLHELSEAKEILFQSRETEPLMRNAIRLIITQVEKSRDQAVPKLAATVASASKAFLDNLEQSKRSIGEVGLKRIRDNTTIFTHCHSSTVTHILRKAKEKNINFELICTESRPVYQGRITVKEMLELGVKTTLIVDSAVRFFMNRADLVMVGADAITSEGNVINKIGTSTVALVAHEARTPFYVVTELLKYDPATIHGDFEKIEERKPDEIWKDAPKDLIIRNPAFDVTRRDFIHGIICEEGIISPHSITEVMHRQYPWVFE